MSLPWSKFFWSDYAADPALRLCSFAAQGLWMRMLCIAAEHEPAGYVAVNGRGLDNQAIARSTGGSVEEVETLLSELEANGVFSRDRRGWIYSRRLVTDAKMRRKASEAGKLGGNPTLRKQREKFDTLKGGDKGSLNGASKPHIPEARNVGKPTTAPPSDPIKELFDLGVQVLTGGGSTEKQARSLIGKWRKAHKDSDVLAALIDARTKGVSEPVEWITKRLGGGAGYVSATGYKYRGDLAAVVREAEKRADWNTYWAAKREMEGARH